MYWLWKCKFPLADNPIHVEARRDALTKTSSFSSLSRSIIPMMIINVNCRGIDWTLGFLGAGEIVILWAVCKISRWSSWSHYARIKGFRLPLYWRYIEDIVCKLLIVIEIYGILNFVNEDFLRMWMDQLVFFGIDKAFEILKFFKLKAWKFLRFQSKKYMEYRFIIF